MSAQAQLAAGNFYSGIAAKKHFPRAYVLSELVQATPRQFPTHHHERDYFFLVIAGDYREGTSRKMHEFRPVSAGFHPKLVPHAGEAGLAGSRMFTIEFADDFVHHADVPLPHDPVVDFGEHDLVWAGLRMFQCFRQAEHADPLSLESIACELLDTVQASRNRRADTAPQWFRRALELLNAAIPDGCSISELAHQTGVHPVHLARVFRSSTGLSPGEYLQRLRCDRACDLLLNSKFALSEVAVDCGFYDQSHMTRMLRRYARTTPRALRALNREH
jgi:AraC family transcriptional regulator